MILKHIVALFCLSAPILAVSSPPTYSNTTITPSYQTPNFTFNELYNLTNRFLQNHMYPLNIAQSLSINSSLLSSDILGRVDATRDYAGRELNTEYLFGLFANIALNPDAFTLLGNFRYLEWQLNSTISSISAHLNLSSSVDITSLLHQKLSQSICTTATTFCNGTNLQYANQTACEDYLYNKTRFGEGWEWGMDTVSCRMIHQNMVPLRPEVHCPHIGPTGGGMCADDRTYVGNLEETYFVNSPFLAPGLAGGVFT
ncbi:hypothetical protein KCU95_g9871, partial [Aureobasidium melanogenum]